MGWPVGIPKTLNPEQRSERARNAAKARTTPEHHIRELGKVTLTAEQRAELARLALAPYLNGDKAQAVDQ